MPSTDVLDNAAWHALRGAHAGFAEGDGAALRYPRDVSVFHAVADDGDASWSALGELARGRTVVLFRATPITPPSGWHLVHDGEGRQMVLEAPSPGPVPPVADDGRHGPVGVRELDAGDVPAMLRLVEQTEPGPFGARTIELGGYVGVFHGDELVAMAGQRLRPPGWCEVSAVCTRADARRRGYASLLTGIVAARIAARGERVLLHVARRNRAAIAAYERLGFVTRAPVRFAVLRPPRNDS